MVAPVFYAFTRYVWALGVPLGMSEEYLRSGQESGTWISGLFLATFGLLGACLMLGLVQRWGEVFPRWMLGLAGRRVPITLAAVPAALASVLLIVGGIGIWSDLGQVVAALAAGGAESIDLVGAIIFQVGPTLLFPVWGMALAMATLGYYYRRRGPCRVCGRGAAGEARSERGQSVTTITAFIKRHPLLSYFVLMFAISLGVALIVVGPGRFPITMERSEPLFLLAMLAFLLGPALAGPLLTGLLDGRAGLREGNHSVVKWLERRRSDGGYMMSTR
ncbi:MAG: hypothetical protein KIT87_29630 [Anaerolineae bacterium]|nr:hypothetical protein [Anaerolineae bacterium]